MAMLGPLVRMPAAHRRDPLALWDFLAPRSQRFLDLPDRRCVLENGVIAGTVGQAHAVDVALDDSRYDSAPLQIDDSRVWPASRRCISNSGEAAVPDRHSTGDGVLRIHRVNPAIDEVQFRRGRATHNRHLCGYNFRRP